MRLRPFRPLIALFVALGLLAWAATAGATPSVARQWNEVLLDAIRNDLARPTVHARNLYHVSVAMWDAWAAYDPGASSVMHYESASADDIEAARVEAISYAAYRILVSRFQSSPGKAVSLAAFDDLFEALGFKKGKRSTTGESPSAVGNRIALAILLDGESDGSNEEGGYANLYYEPANEPLVPSLSGNPTITDLNRWQPLALQFFTDQAGNVIPYGSLDFLSPEWGDVTPFALSPADRTVEERDGHQYVLYHDPGPPPALPGPQSEAYKDGFEQVIRWSALLDPTDGSSIDISPASRGNNTLGANDGTGWLQNPSTQQPYVPQVVPAADYYRVLAEFWADGPDSETPPGHWFTIANYVSDHPQVSKRIGGVGPVLGDLEWDVKVYLALGGAMHDAAIAAWGAKGWYDHVRPISAIRAMADLGQSSDMGLPHYHADGLRLVPGEIELVTNASTQPGERHEHLLAPGAIDKIAIRAWRGPDHIADPATDTAGVGWILAENWWPYQRPTFVTPPFAGYVSGHSTYSRAAAEVLTRLTGDPFFPGGLGEFLAPQDQFLVFEQGPSVDIRLQWATYYDAADECSLSRIYGGIHPPHDDIPGRIMGAAIGAAAFDFAKRNFDGENQPPIALPIGHGFAAVLLSLGMLFLSAGRLRA